MLPVDGLPTSKQAQLCDRLSKEGRIANFESCVWRELTNSELATEEKIGIGDPNKTTVSLKIK